MNDSTTVLAGCTTKYNIPLSHFEYKYIENCKDAKELERIYKELTSGEIGSFPALEQLTLDRIRDLKPNSQLLRKDKAPLDRSALPEDERQQFDDFLIQMQEINRTSLNVVNDHKNNDIDSVPIRSKTTISKSLTPTPSVPLINTNGKSKRIVPRSYDEWGKLDKQIAQEFKDGNDDDDESSDNDNRHNDKKNKKQSNQSFTSNSVEEKSQHLQTAEQCRLNGNTAFKANNYEQSIDLYTKSIMLDNTNPMAYMNRAIAYYKLNNYDASITDCSQVLSKDHNHIKALFRRASCFIAKSQYEDAKRDLEILLTIDEENVEAKNLLKTIPIVQKPKGVRIPITEDDEDEEEVPVKPSIPTPVKIPILEVDEEEEEEEMEEKEDVVQEQEGATNDAIQSMNIDIPQQAILHSRPCIGSEDASPALFDDHFQSCANINQFQQNVNSQLQSLDTGVVGDDDDDDMPLGDEAGSGCVGTMSDDDGHVSHSLNVSPTMDDDEYAPALVDLETLKTPLTSQPIPRNINEDNNAYMMHDISNKAHYSTITNDDYNDLYDNNNASTTTSQNYSTKTQSSMPSKSFEMNDQSYDLSAEQRSSTMDSNNDHISNSNFGSTIQNWLRDTAATRANNRSSTWHEKPWSKSSRPLILNNLQRDIQKYSRSNDYRNTVEAAKKMLKNGVLDYHNHADHIVSTLVLCANSYLKSNDYVRTIQYTSEALQYNRIDTDALMSRAKAFENENFLLFSYADYINVPSTDFSYSSVRRTCERLAVDLDVNEGENWREKLPLDDNDGERYFTYIKTKDGFDDNDQYDWYRKRGNQLYLDACFVLAIRCYTKCIELKPIIAASYSNRAACYLKVFEPQKAIDDCNKALEIEPNSVRTLYRKACVYKMSGNMQFYELTLRDLIKLQPYNQTILAEYYNSRHEPIPRNMRRLRTNTGNTKLLKSSTSSSAEISQVKNPIERNSLSYDELEQMRIQKLVLSARHQFEQQLNSLKPNDIKGQCLLILRLPTKGLYKVTGPLTSKVVETIVNACQIMIEAEKCYQQENKSSIIQFSYIKFCFDILVELTTLPRLDSALAMIDQMHRTTLDDLITYFSSISSIFTDVSRLDRLRNKN